MKAPAWLPRLVAAAELDRLRAADTAPGHGAGCRDDHTLTLERRLATVQRQLDAAMGYDGSQLREPEETVPAGMSS